MAASSVPGTVRVILVDADHRVRECLRDLLSLADGVEVVAAVGHPAAAMEVAGRTDPHVVVIDPRLPELEAGLALVDGLRTGFPGVRVLLMGWTGALEPAAAQSGAHGALDRTAHPDDLVARIIAAAKEAA